MTPRPMFQPTHPPGDPRRVSIEAPRAPAAVSLQQWIPRARRSLSKDDYLDCAVTVARGLADHLRRVAGTGGEDSRADFDRNLDSWVDCADSWNDSGDFCLDFLASPGDEKKDGDPSVGIEDIVPERVLVVVANNIFHDASRASFMATEVTIQPTSEITSQSPQFSQSDVCFALGTILFELFSQGDPLLLIELDSNNEEDDLFSDWLLEDIGLDDLDALPSASKKTSKKSGSSSAAVPTSSKAKFFLQEQGLPRSVCQLVSDLLENKTGNEFLSDTAIQSLEEAQFDLMRMKTHPERFLHDQTSPGRALDDTALFRQTDGELYGREGEINAMMDIIGRITLHVPAPCGMDDGTGERGQHGSLSVTVVDDSPPTSAEAFLCEAVFLSGHSGSGKSSVIRKLLTFCNANDWCVLVCKFDRQVAPLSALLQSIDNLFGEFLPKRAEGHIRRDPSAQETFNRISRSVASSIDSESFAQLCELLPNLGQLFSIHNCSPAHSVVDLTDETGNGDALVDLTDETMLVDLTEETNNGDALVDLTHVTVMDKTNEANMDLTDNTKNASAAGAMGSGRNRLNYLFHIVFKAVCSGGHPVLICLDDLQWADSATLDIVGDFIEALGCGTVCHADGRPLKGGLLYVGSFRDNEVDEKGFVMNQINRMEQPLGIVNVSKVAIGELPELDVNKMLSFMFCLPMRHTRELSRLVNQKTRGYPMFTIEFLRSIIQQNAMTFSVKDRRWVWDSTAIEMQLISEGVVELLTKKLELLPDGVIQTLMVMSCFGAQTNLPTIQLLDLGQFVPDMTGALDIAVKEGILERAGSIFAFSHDMLQEASYKLIPIHERKGLHKRIATSLVQGSEVAKNSELCILAVDQANICKDSDGALGPVERAQFARLNLAAGRHCLRTSSYEQARTYFEAGISLLHANHWDRQYSLSLQLYEQSVVVSFMDGYVDGVSSLLNDILSNAKSFDDKLNARAMLAQLSVSQERWTDGLRDIIDLLSDLGEHFPKEIDRTHAASEIEATLPLLEDITKEKVRALPVMKEQRKLNAMKFLDLLTTFCNFCSPMLMHLLSCRMVQLTFRFGFCDETIVGLVTFSHVLWLYSNNIDTSKRIIKIAEALMRENPNGHLLKARLTMMITSVLGISEPVQALLEGALNGYKSATIVGDIDNAMLCGLVYCMLAFNCTKKLMDLQRSIVKFMHEMAKHKRIGLLHSTMCFLSACIDLIGNKDSSGISTAFEMKTNAELHHVAKETQNNYLMHHVLMTQMCVHCFFKKHLHVIELAEEYQINHVAKRALDILPIFYEGISALVLARDTKQEKWRRIGEKSVVSMKRFTEYSNWNWECTLLILQAELHYLDERHTMAEISYKAAIESTRERGFPHMEAFARELYGVYLVESKKLEEGIGLLVSAMDKYRHWGAIKKADAVQDFIHLVQQPTHLWKANRI